MVNLAAAEPGPNQAYLQSKLYTTTEGLEALVRILGHELNITCRSCPADLIRSAVSCPVNCKLPLDSQGEGGRENEVNVWRALFGSKKETHHSKRPEIKIEVCTPYFNLPSMCVWPNRNCVLASNI